MSWAAAIGAGASLLGGIFDRNQRNREMRATEPAAIRRKAEAAGFNPLLFTNQAFQMPAGAPSMGASIADAASMYLGERGRQQQLELQRAELEMANQRLTDLAERARLRPTYPGPYQGGANENSARRISAPRSVSGGDDSSGGADGVTPPNQELPTETNPSQQVDLPFIRENPYMPSADDITMQYGEPAEWLYAPVKIAGDVGHTIYRTGVEATDDARNVGLRLAPSVPATVRQGLADRNERVNSQIEDMNAADDEWVRDRFLRSNMTTPRHMTGPSLRDVGSTNPWNQRVDTLRPINRF